MRSINVLLSILVSLTLAFLVFEFGLRLFPEYRPHKTVNEFHPRLGWTKSPGIKTKRATREFNITFEINAEGLRDDTGLTPAKKENTFRVMALGDSFTLGYTVDREDLFVDQIDSWWKNEQRRTEVINAGTEGYSTDQEALWFAEYGAAYQPDVVLLFPYENDIYWNGQERYTRFPKPRYTDNGVIETGTLEDPGPGPRLRNFASGRFLVDTVRPALLWTASKLGLSKNQAANPNQFEVQGTPIFKEFAPLLVDEPSFLKDAEERTRGSLIALKAKCDEIGARLVMVPVPSEAAIGADAREDFRTSKYNFGLNGLDDSAWSPDRPVDFFLGLGRELGIETLDPRSTLRASHEAGGKPLYFEKEWHFTPHGNRVFAEYLIRELNTLQIFPSEHAAIAEGHFDTEESGGGVPTWMIVFASLWAILGTAFKLSYKTEPALACYGKVGALLALVFTMILGGAKLVAWQPLIAPIFILIVLGFVAYKLGRRVVTIAELMKAFTLRGHWYLMPLVVVLLTVGSLLVVAASSPLIAPFIYTLF